MSHQQKGLDGQFQIHADLLLNIPFGECSWPRCEAPSLRANRFGLEPRLATADLCRSRSYFFCLRLVQKAAQLAISSLRFSRKSDRE